MKKSFPLVAAFFLFSSLTACAPIQNVKNENPQSFSSMQLLSSAFEPNTSIPSQFTCDGAGEQPPLTIKDVPADAVSLALTLVDPDTAKGDFVHWVAWNLPPATADVQPGNLPPGMVQGKNGAGKNIYSGPCPPTGTHHYIFTLYALDTALDLPPATDRAGLLNAIHGHEVGRAELTGLYQRS